MSTEIKQRTPEWYQARIGRITGSRVGAILGVSPYQTRQATLRDMVKEAIGEKADYDNDAMRWGRDNEEKARHIYEFLYAGSDEVKETGFWTHGDYLGASPDALVGDEGLVEIKCPYGLRDEEHPMFTSIEERQDYWHQIQCQLFVTGRKWCDFFQWSPHGHRNERVYRDETWLEENDPALCEFIGDYRAAVENAATGGPEERVGRSSRWAAAVEAYNLAKRVRDAAAEDMDTARNTLIELCEEANIDQCSGAGMQATKVLSKGRVDYKLMAQDNMPNFEAAKTDYTGEPTVSWRLTQTKGE